MAKTYKNMEGEEMLDRLAEKESSKEDEDDEVEMSRKELIAEHKKLVKILRSGDKKALLAEAQKQEKELKKYL